jgi:ribosomal protein L14E/L6E/L27E
VDIEGDHIEESWTVQSESNPNYRLGRIDSTSRLRHQSTPFLIRSRRRHRALPLKSHKTNGQEEVQIPARIPARSILTYIRRVEKRSKIKPFIKQINYNHIMPTRYTLELEGLKNVLSNDTFKEVSQREDAKKQVKKALEERYTSGKNRWFFTPLRF